MRNATHRRLHLQLPAESFDELRSLADTSGRSMTEIVRTGLSLANLAYTEASRDRILVVATKDGQIVKEILLPK